MENLKANISKFSISENNVIHEKVLVYLIVSK